jgi:hypothetical protein
MSEPLLSKSEIDELNALLPKYYEQAMLCQKSDAYLPGSIMLGSCLETLLLIIVASFPKEALKTKTAKMYNLHEKKLLKWDFYHLIDVALEAGWLPVAIATANPDDQKNIPLAAYVHVLRRARNLVHAGKYLKELKHKNEITPAYLRSCFKIWYDAYGHLDKAFGDRLNLPFRIVRER